ncbi:two-component sensor histidine kinase, partial [Candidatus Symbiopectobacterium sp. NZEC135]|nr:two-component sensor histidine kinase [Candidatus Symbiopectobacterium sp. NZEC135]
MNNTNRYSFWRWICLHILTLAIGTVVIIALCMWLRFEIYNYWVMHDMPTALREEFEALRQH